MKRNPYLSIPRHGKTCPELPSFWLLLDDPEAVLLDPDRWPPRLCPEMLKISTWFWASHDHRPWFEAEDVWPLPVGAQAARAFLWDSLEDEDDPDAPSVQVTGEDIADRAPFKGNQLAALASR